MTSASAFVRKRDDESDFRRLLDDATATAELSRLQDHAIRFGVPAALRAPAWRLLLALGDSYDRFVVIEEDHVRALDATLVARIRQDMRAFYASADADDAVHAESRSKFEQLLFAFLRHHTDIAYHKRLIYFLRPFFAVFRDETECYASYSRFVEAFEAHVAERQISVMLANFTMLLRHFFPDLLSYIEDEELSPNEWALPWLRNLLCTDLRLQNVLRLLDAYFGVGPDAFELHTFACLAILQYSQEDMFEMEYSEMKGFLRSPPLLRMDQILAQAFALQREVAQGKLL